MARAVSKPLRLPIADIFTRARGSAAVGGKLEAGALKVPVLGSPLLCTLLFLASKPLGCMASPFNFNLCAVGQKAECSAELR